MRIMSPTWDAQGNTMLPLLACCFQPSPPPTLLAFKTLKAKRGEGSSGSFSYSKSLTGTVPGHAPVKHLAVPVHRSPIPNPSLEPSPGLGLPAARQEAAKIKFAFIYSIEGSIGSNKDGNIKTQIQSPNAENDECRL